MKFSKAWLQTYSKEPLPETKKLGEIVTFNAFEIEEVTSHNGDDVLDIKVLPNRAHDALGHRGMARDIVALVGNTFIDPNLYYKGTAHIDVITPTITIEDNKACTRFMSVRIDGVTITESPEWLKTSLNAIGQKSINSIVDITNYVQFALNKPMHAYDASLIEGNTLMARFAKSGEKLTTLDDKELLLDSLTLVIADAIKPLGLAGIKGGKFSGISSATTSIILESANFNPTLIRKTSQKYNTRTDASKRFENEISDTLAEEGLRMTIALIEKLNPTAKVGAIVDVYPQPSSAVLVCVSVSEVNQVLGTSYTSSDIAGIFAMLGFSYTEADGLFTVTAPDERLDIRIKEDLIEEVARIKGLSSIPSVLPQLNRKGVPHKRLYYENKIRNILYEYGFSDIMTYSFGDTGEVEIVKGLASDKEKLRSNLSSGVQKAFQMNMLNAPLLNLQTIKMYEFGNVFTKDTERRHLALIIDDAKKKSSFTEEVDLLLSQIKRELGVESLHYETAQAKPYTIELDFDTLIESLPEPSSYEPLTQSTPTAAYKAVSAYPFIARDIAMWVPGDVTWEDIRSLVAEVGNTLVARIDLFDTFEKEIDGVRKVSYAFRLVFQSFERTLTDEEVNEMMGPYYEVLKAKGYEIR